MEYAFTGKVWYEDEPGVGSSGLRIGDKSIPADINFPSGTRVTCGIADAKWDGEISIETGWGYSEWTVMESDTLEVGEHNILDIIGRYEGQEITFFISDGPINILEHVNKC